MSKFKVQSLNPRFYFLHITYPKLRSWKWGIGGWKIILLSWLLIALAILFQKPSFDPKFAKAPEDSNFFYQNTRNPFKIYLGSRQEEKVPAARFEVGENEFIEFEGEDLQASKVKLVGKRLLFYEDVKDNVDLTYQIAEEGLKEEIILKKKAVLDAAGPAFSFLISYPKEMEIKERTPNELGFFVKNAGYLFHLAKPFMEDGRGQKSEDVAIRVRRVNPVTEKGDEGRFRYRVTLLPDRSWLADEDRKYPILLDPTIIHDTPGEFSSGDFNRTTESGSSQTSKLETSFEELPADTHTAGLWHINETSGSNVADSSGNGYDGTATGTSIVPGKLNNARDLGIATTSDYISLGYQALEGVEDFTVEAWAATVSNTNLTLLSGANSSQFNDLVFYFGTDRIFAPILKGTGYAGTFVAYTDDAWHHYAMVRDNSTLLLYVDGSLVDTISGVTVAPLDIDSGGLIVGQEQDSLGGGFQGGQAWSGPVDEIRVSNIALSPEEIKAHANRRPYGIYTSPVIDFGQTPISLNALNWVDNVTPPDYPSGYTRVKPVLIDNTQNSSALTNYQVKVHMDYDSNMQSDFDDLRFTDSDGTNLDYWIESKSDGVEAEVWIEVDSIPANDWKAVFMFYGNSGAGAGSNVGNTFIFGDDFNDGTISSSTWPSQNLGSYIEESGGTLNVTGVQGGTYYIKSSALASSIIPVIIEARAKTTTVPDNGWTPVSWWQSTTEGASILEHAGGTAGIHYTRDDADWTQIGDKTLTEWHRNKLILTSSSGWTARAEFESTTSDNWSAGYSNTFSGDYYIEVVPRHDHSDYGLQTMDGKVDFIFIRQYTPVEPTASVGASIDFQTRTSADSSSWEAWKPTTSETAIASMDSDVSNWVCMPSADFTQSWKKYDNVTASNCDSVCEGNGKVGLGSSGRGDDAHVYEPSVLLDDSTYKIWYAGHDETNIRLYYATSSDGLTWTKADNTTASDCDSVCEGNGKLGLGSSGRGDDYHTYRASVIKDGSTYKMWYSGYAGADDPHWRIYYATSSDGLTWTKADNTTASDCDSVCEGNGKVGLGSSGKGDSNHVLRPTVIKDGSTYKMWYTGTDASGVNRIYYATSSDGLTWTKADNTTASDCDSVCEGNGKVGLGSNGAADDAHAYTPTVIKDGSLYKMWYSAHEGTNVRMAYAYSTDGLTWTKYDNGLPTASNGSSTNGRVPLGAGSTGDITHAFSPTVIKVDNTYKMWYMGYNAAYRIYYATMDLATLPTAKADDSTIKMEGTGSMKTTVGAPQVDGFTAGLWHMEETTGSGAYIKDSTGNNNHGTPTGTSTTDGFFGKARSFNGSSDYINIPNSASLDLGTGDFTVELWFKGTTFHSSTNAAFIEAADATGDFWPLIALRGNNDGTLSYYIRDDDSDQVAGTTTQTYNDNNWHHAAIIRAGIGGHLYVDGVQVLDGSSAGLDNVSTGDPWYIGRTYDSTSRYINASIDEVRISNVARTAEEIAEAYRAGRDYRVERTLSSTDLSDDNKIPFYIASDRPGTNLEAYIGESTNSVYGADSNTAGLWHLDDNPNPEADPLANTQVLYHLNETSGTSFVDASGNGKTGTASGTVTLAGGKFGSGRSFSSDSNDVITFSDTNLGTDHTVEAWVQFPLSSSATWRTLFANNGGNYHYILVQTGTNLLGVYNAGWYSCGYDVTNISSGWHHLAAVGTGSTTVFYLDGATLCTSSTKISGQNIGAIGNSSTSGGQGWGASIDEVRISSRALNPSEFLKRKIIKDSTSYANHGDNLGSAITQGKIGKARSFNGSSDYIDVPSLTSISSPFTVEAWAKMNSYRDGYYPQIVTKWYSGGPNRQFVLGYSDASDTIYGQIFDETDDSTQSVLADFQQPLGEWFHAAMTFDGTDLKLYINGYLNDSQNAVGDYYDDTAVNVQIGNNVGASNWWDGVIDEVRISNVARTPAEIRQTYQYGLRTHPITTDFVSNPQATYSSGTSITINNPWGTGNLTDTLSVGDTMIIRENKDGTEYIAQAEVTAIDNTASTYGTVTLEAAFSPIPLGGYTTSAKVFKWQREYFDLRGISEADRNATTKLGIGVLDGSQAFTFWLDDFRSNGNYLHLPFGNTITSTANRYFQYRAIIAGTDGPPSSSNSQNTPAPQISRVTVNYTLASNEKDARPVVQWKFDEGYGAIAYDETINNHDASLNNMEASDWVDGRFGRAVAPDGTNEYLSVASSADVNFGDHSMSISAFVNTSQSGATYTIIDKYASSSGYKLQLNSTGRVVFQVGDGTNTPSVTGNKAVNDGQWHSIVAVRDKGANLKVYVDGVYDNQASDTANNIDSTVDVVIARDSAGANYYIGKLDELNLYDYALSASQAKVVHNGGFGTVLGSAEDWMSGWSYRKSVVITNSGSDLTDYQVAVTLDTATLITDNKMQSDCDDIRFTDASGVPLSHWIEENSPGCNNASTRIWVKALSIPSSGATIYVYYGNPSAANTEDGSQVFEFFDDFNDNSFDTAKWETWTMGGAAVTEENQQLHQDGDLSQSSDVTTVSASFPVGRAFRAKMKRDDNGTYCQLGLLFTNDSGGTASRSQDDSYTEGLLWRNYNDDVVLYSNGGAGTTVYGSDLTQGQWYYGEIIRKSSNTAKGTLWDSGYSQLGTNEYTVTDNTDDLYVSVYNGGSYGDSKVDYAFVRKYADPEPSVGTPGSETQIEPVGYWKFDEGYGDTAYDETSNDNDGALQNMESTDWVAGKFGKALDFDGNNEWVNMGNGDSLKHFTSITVSAWMKTTSSGDMQVVSKASNTGPTYADYILLYVNSSGNAVFGFRDESNTEIQLASDNTVNDGKWHHLVGVRDYQNNVYIYVDGVGKSTPDTGTDEIYTECQLTVGNWRQHACSGDLQNFDGEIDEVKVYNYPLTADKIKVEYNQSSAVRLGNARDINAGGSGPVGFWKLDEAADTTANDSSGNGNTGTINSAAWETNGKIGSALDFDGTDDRVDIADNASMEVLGSWTVSMWLNTDSVSGSHVIFQPAGAGGTAFWNINTSGTEVRYTNNNVADYPSSGFGLSTGTWTHIAVVKDGTTVSFYKNGVYISQQTSVTEPASFSTGTGRLGCKAEGGANSTFYDGKIDHLRFYNYVRSPKQLAMDFSGGKPVGWWKLDEVSGMIAYDEYVHDNDGALTNMEEADHVNGKIGRALDFDADNDYVEVTRDSSIEPNQLTVSAWIYIDSNITPETMGVIFDKANTSHSSPYYDYHLRLASIDDTPTLDGYVVVGGFSGDDEVACISCLTKDEWYHVAMTFDEQEIKLYVNGALRDTQSNPGSITYHNTNLFIGAYRNLTNGNFPGKIDEAKIYNYARSAAEVKLDYNSGAVHFK